MRAVDRSRANEGCLAGERLEYPKPDPLAAPAVEAVIDRRIGTVFGRAVAPACPGLQHVDDTADDATIVHPVRTSSATGQQRLNPSELRIAQPVRLWHHALHISPESLNHKSRPLRIR